MREIEMDFYNEDFFDVMINELEKEYGRTVARLAKIDRLNSYSFEIAVIFSDFRLLEAQVKVIDNLYDDEPIVQIRGEYF